MDDDSKLVDERSARDPIRVMVAESNPHLAAVLCWVLSHDERFRVVAQARDGDDG
jgi:hypothetical protein